MSKKILTLDNVPVINKKIGKIDTIEKLKASTIYSIGDVVEVLGFHAKGDGSHHKRIAKAENDGSGEQGQNGIWWCIVHNGEVNASWFGAKGDGTDSTLAIQKAIDYCKNMVAVLNLFGRLKTSATLEISLGLDINLNNSYIEFNAPICFKFKNEASKSSIKGGVLVSRYPTYGIGIQAGETKTSGNFLKNFSVKNVAIQSCLVGMDFNNIVDLHVEKNDLIHNILGIRVNQVVFGRFIYNDIIKGTTPRQDYGIQFLTKNESIFLKHNRVFGYHQQVVLQNILYGELKDNDIDGGTGVGVSVGDGLTNFDITDNWVAMNRVTDDVFVCGIHIKSNDAFAGEILISRNKVRCGTSTSQKANHCIKNERGSRVFIKDNVFWAGSCIESARLENSTTCFVEGNQFLGAGVFVVDSEVRFSNNYFQSTIFQTGSKLSFSKDKSDSQFLGGIFSAIYPAGSKSISISPNKPFISGFNFANSTLNVTNPNNIFVGAVKCKYGTTPTELVVEKEVAFGGISNLILEVSLNTFREEGTVTQTANSLVIETLDTPYYALKMQQEGVYNDFIQYMDEKTEYDRLQRELEQQRQLAFEQRENQEQTYEEWLATQPVLIPDNEPQPSEKLLEFKNKYIV